MVSLSFFPLLSFAEKPYFDPVEKYRQGGIVEILIVPGHDDESFGTAFRGMKEADMTLMLSKKLAKELASDPQVFVTLARDEEGYFPPLQEYFDENEREINKFIKDSKAKTERSFERENELIINAVTHNDASKDVAYRLYGINKWISEENFDLVIHVHMNDDTSHVGSNVGTHSGYVIYVPEVNLPNAEHTKPFAESIGRELQKTFYPSDLPLEAQASDEAGLVPDFKLIALGSNKTLEIPSVLIEYSYIYEPNLSKEFFGVSSTVMARATSRGVFNYLGGIQSWNSLSYSWKKPLAISAKKDEANLALQYGLKELGFFPPKNMTRNSCPFTGIFGPCTQRSVKEFQKAKGLKADGAVGPKTIAVLNSIFGF